jgi:sugar lactone lactonase YvrE
VVVDTAGNLYIADKSNQRIRKVSTSGIITTVAGNGTWGYSGDGGAATSAMLADPSDVAVDSLGNLYINDWSNKRIRKVDTSGIITTVAGNGIAGYAGDGGAATSAMLSNPFGVAVDAAGNLFIADSGNQRIRKVSTSGIITTVAGNGTYGYSGDGGAATSAMLSDPYGVTVDAAGNLFIADSGNQRIRKVSTSGIITTVAGNGTAGYAGDGGAATSGLLSGPQDVAVDSAGNLYIADTFNSVIRKVSTSGIITTVAGNGTAGYAGDGGAAILAQLYRPFGLAADSSGNLYIADSYNYRIRKVQQ